MKKIQEGQPLDQRDRQLLGRFDFKYPPEEVLQRAGELSTEPSLSIQKLVDYYFGEVSEKGAIPKLTMEKRKEVMEAATNLGLITVDPEKGFEAGLEQAFKNLFKVEPGGPLEPKIKALMKNTHERLKGRIILTKNDFDPGKGPFAEVGNEINNLHKLSLKATANLDQNEALTPEQKQYFEAVKEYTEELKSLFEHSEIATGFVAEGIRAVGKDYQKLVDGKMKTKELEEWFNIFGPSKNENSIELMTDKFFGKDSVAMREFKKKAEKVGKAGSMILMLMILLEGYLASKTISGQPQHG